MFLYLLLDVQWPVTEMLSGISYHHHLTMLTLTERYTEKYLERDVSTDNIHVL